MAKTKGFDISTLLEFQPPEVFCERCLALLRKTDFTRVTLRDETFAVQCPACGVLYLPNEFTSWQVGEYLHQAGFGINQERIIQRCVMLAGIARDVNDASRWKWVTPMSSLLRAFAAAESFIHIMSWGFSSFFVGALKLKAQAVAVRGTVSMQNQKEFLAEISDVTDAPRFEVHMVDTRNNEMWANAPHHKLVIIDGLLALTGSANLTTPAWRSVLEGKEHIEAITDLARIAELHNRYFSHFWAESKQDGGAKSNPISMMRPIPF